MSCQHVAQIQDVTPKTDGCEVCLQIGQRWISLRLCLTCGFVGCCDSSPGKHATQHFHESRHPIVQSLEAWENWRWCYIDETFV